jgi:outer membrane protein assembly factor BamB
MLKNKKITFIIILIVLALALAGCAGGRRVAATGWSGITVSEEIVYFSYGPQAYAVNLSNGSLKWAYPAEPVNGLDFYAAPVLADGGTQLIVGSFKNEIFSLDPQSGIKNWSYTVSSENNSTVRFIASPLAVEGHIYAPASNNTLYAFSLDGALEWSFETGDPLWATPIYSENCGCVYQVSMDHYLYALDPAKGTLNWKSEDLGGPMVNPPTLSESGLIIISTFNNEVIAINEESRQVEWRFKTSDWAWASPLIDGDQVYVSDISGNFYALDLASGDLLWQVAPGGGIYSAALVVDGLIYFATDTSSLVVLSQDGVIQRNQPVDGILYASPVAAGDKLLLAPSESEFYLLALNDSGVQLWGYPPPK